jgi:hypothetical protein
MYFDRLDIVEAHYTYAMFWHNGQTCPLYARLCRIARRYTPGPLFRGFESLSENAQAIYKALRRRRFAG